MRRQLIWILLGVTICSVVLAYWFHTTRGERRYDRVIRQAARRYTVDPGLVKAVIWRESRFNSNARGGSGELGLMQVRSLAGIEWAKSARIQRFSHEDLIDPSSNTLAGTWYLGKLLNRYKHTDDPLPYALADYNAGRTHVLRWMKESGSTNSAVFRDQIDFPSTQRYISAVLNRYDLYRRDRK